jgi:hypothetical protein
MFQDDVPESCMFAHAGQGMAKRMEGMWSRSVENAGRAATANKIPHVVRLVRAILHPLYLPACRAPVFS